MDTDSQGCIGESGKRKNERKTAAGSKGRQEKVIARKKGSSKFLVVEIVIQIHRQTRRTIFVHTFEFLRRRPGTVVAAGVADRLVTAADLTSEEAAMRICK